HTPDLDPVSYLGMERVAPHTESLPAPLRLDCALTYTLPPGVDADDAPTKRVTRELTTDEWRAVLDKAWAAGVPHIIFTGGEPTLRPDLPDLIAHAEKNGQVAGLLTDGLKLADKAYLDTLLQTGLDHLLFVLQPENEQSWQALSMVMPEDIFTTVHLTLTPARAAALPATLRRLSDLGVTSVSFTAPPDMRAALETARDLAAEHRLSLVWDLPVPYSASNPVALETAEDAIPSGAGKSWLYIEPDGDVLPSQGMPGQVLGNILTDAFTDIYKN
ncbi:MAG: radical SAM protein, partial [Anaerolineales bacterium]